MSRRSPKFSVIMRAKNADWVIGQALAGLAAQNRQDHELIVVDSGSTDQTLEIVKRYDCRLVRIPGAAYYPGAVLNAAIAQHVRTELIVFQNSDVVPLTPDTLDHLLAPLERGEAVASFARQLPRPEAHGWVRRDYAEAFPAHGEAPPWITLSLPLAAMTKRAWQQHPFYEDAWGSEDSEWGHWARAQGLRVAYVPEATVMHSHNYTLRQLYGRRFIEGEADAFIYGGALPLHAHLRRYVSAVGRDLRSHLQAGDLLGGLAAPVRRGVYQWAYYKGYRWGCHRQAAGIADASHGQRQVLSRYQ